MANNINLYHERVDDVPLLIGLMKKIRLSKAIDKCLGTHGHQKGLSNGDITVAWLAYILSKSDHSKYKVEKWSLQNRHALEKLLGHPIRKVDFRDARLTNLAKRMSNDTNWKSLESELWGNTINVYDVGISSVRLDSTTVSGYHKINENGVMQVGHSKEHRPDLPQLKLMAAAAEPSGYFMAGDIYPGNRADDPLYIPIIERIRDITNRKGLLYIGDSKMAAIKTRAAIVKGEDYYLMPLPLTGKTRKNIDNWIDDIVAGEKSANLVFDEKRLLAAGYEFERELHVQNSTEQIRWRERVLVVRSFDMVKAQQTKFSQRLDKAEAQLHLLTPPPGRGKRQYKTENDLRKAVAKILKKYKVNDLLLCNWQREEQINTRYVGRGRGGSNRETRTEVKVRYVITKVLRNYSGIEDYKHRLGWRALVTNLLQEDKSFTQTVIHYRRGWSIERNFHLVKDLPLGLGPIFVTRDDQIIGTTRLLTLALALRLLVLIEDQVRQKLQHFGEELTGLYPGQPKRKTAKPTALRILETIVDQNITLTKVDLGVQQLWHLTPLSELVVKILGFLELSPSIYKCLNENSS